MALGIFARRPAIQKIVEDPEVFATTLVTLLVDARGTEALQWGPETLRKEFHMNWGATLPTRNEDKLLGAVTILTTDAFYKDARRFLDLTHALVGNGVPLETFEPPTVEECCWAVAEATLLHPEPNTAFAPAVRGYLRETLSDGGYLGVPAILNGIADAPPLPAYPLSPVVHEQQARRVALVHAMIMRNMRELADQLAALPLEHGDPTALQQRLAPYLGAKPKK